MSLYIKAKVVPGRNGRFVEVQPITWHLLDLLIEAVALANRLECGVEFEFNTPNQIAWVDPCSDPHAQFEFFKRLWKL